MFISLLIIFLGFYLGFSLFCLLFFDVSLSLFIFSIFFSERELIKYTHECIAKFNYIFLFLSRIFLYFYFLGCLFYTFLDHVFFFFFASLIFSHFIFLIFTLFYFILFSFLFVCFLCGGILILSFICEFSKHFLLSSIFQNFSYFFLGFFFFFFYVFPLGFFHYL